MEGIDMGMKQSETGMMAEKTDKNKITYPSVSVEKDMGMKMGQKVIMEGEVTGLRKGKNGDSTTFEIKKCKAMGEKSDKPDGDWSPKEIMKYRREHKE